MSPDRGADNNDPKRRALHNTLRRKQRSDVPPATTPAQDPQPSEPVRRGNTLVRRRRSNPAAAPNPAVATRKAEVPRETRAPSVKRPHEPQPVKARRHSHNDEHHTHHEAAPKDTRDTSNVWIRRTIKDRLSLSSVNPRLLLSGIKPPHLFQVLTGQAKPKEEPRPPPPPLPKTKRPHRHRHHGEHRHRHRSNGDSHKRPVPPIPIPTPVVAEVNSEEGTRKHRHRHRNAGGAQKRPVPPVPMPMPMPMPVATSACGGAIMDEQHEPKLSSTPLLEPMAYNMPTPTHIIIPSEVIQQTSQDADLQLCEVSPIEMPQPGSDPAHNGQTALVASRVVPLVYADRKHRLSTASVDDDSHPVRVYKVLGRVNSTLDSGTNVAQSPILVTMPRSGSITSEVSLMPRRSEENSSSLFYSAASVIPSLRSPPISSLISKQLTDGVSRTLSPGQQTVSTGGATSMGGESFTTARLYTGTMSPTDLTEKVQPDSGAVAKSLGADNARSRCDSDVSDIAMRNHLVITDDRANFERSRPGSIHSGYELPASANRTFSEWLLTQTATNQSAPLSQGAETSATITQAVARSPSVGPAASSNSDGSPRVPGQFPQSFQRHYFPPATRVSNTASNEEAYALNLLQARVSDLETRFTCMEALLASIEDELSDLDVTPRTLSRLRRAVSATRLPAGTRPVVRAVTLAPSVAGLQSQTDLASSPHTSTAYGRSDDASSDVDREDTVVAVQTTAAALADLVGKSRREFDEATNSALSSISALVNGMQTMRRLDKSLADTADAEQFVSKPDN